MGLPTKARKRAGHDGGNDRAYDLTQADADVTMRHVRQPVDGS
jgi:hypothetical protein